MPVQSVFLFVKIDNHIEERSMRSFGKHGRLMMRQPGREADQLPDSSGDFVLDETGSDLWDGLFDRAREGCGKEASLAAEKIGDVPKVLIRC